MKRTETKRILVGGVPLGGGAPIPVQSMCCAPPHDFDALLTQIRALEDAGCDIIRLTVPDAEAARVFARLKEVVQTPLVADIHFDPNMAIAAIEAGADKIRINPGNLGGEVPTARVAKCARLHHTPVRVGINAGSLEPELLKRYGHPCAEALRDSALTAAALLEEGGVSEIVLSVKSSDVRMTVEANRLLADACSYPLHLSVTEAGTLTRGLIKNSAGIGALLLAGIGDTLRVSLTAPPVEEVRAGRELLQSCGLVSSGIELISCPTCGRTKVTLIPIVEELEARILSARLHPKRVLHIAVMGCAVNGPGEAREADLGAACGDGEALLFAKGEPKFKVPADKLVDTLMAEIARLCE